MRIAFFTDTYEPQKNGVVTSINLFKRELERRGHKVLIFCPRSKELRGRKGVVQFRSVTYRPYPEYRLAFPSPKLLLTLKRFKPDIIHAHSPGPIGVAGLSGAKILKVPFVFTYHTDLDKYTDYIPFKKFKKMSGKVLKRFLRMFLERSDIVIFPGREIMKRFGRRIQKPDTVVLPTGLPSKTRKHARGDERFILHVGRLCKERRVDVLLKAFKRLDAQDLKLYITSKGPDLEKLKELSKKLGIADKVEFFGYVSEREKTELYRRAEIFVTPSPSDTQGLVALEAMQCGTPVIAAQAGGFIDYIEDGKNGLFFRPNNHKDLTEKIRKLLKDKSLWRKISKNGYRTVKEFNMKNLGKKLIAIYEGHLPGKNVSVVVPAKNEEKYIGACLKALRKQTIKPEIIVVDGHSTDRTFKIAKKYADKVVLDRRKGIADARNMGAKAAGGKIVAYCDADSRPHPEWVKSIVRYMRGRDCISGPIIPYDGGFRQRSNMKLWAGWVPSLLSYFGLHATWGPNMAFKREALLRNKFRIDILEDWEIARRIRKNGKVRFVPALKMPVSSRRYKEGFYRVMLGEYAANFLRFRLFGRTKSERYWRQRVSKN